jgi:hypothetical protein
MKHHNTVLIVVFVLLITAFLIMLEQQLTFGSFWSWDQFLHHENIAAVIAAFSVGLGFGFKLNYRKK